MRLALPIAGLAMLAACNQGSTTEQATPEPIEQAVTPVVQPGLYSVGDDTTDYGTTRLNADGTYIDYGDDNEIVGGGTWRTTGDQLCFDPDGDSEAEQENCWTNEPADEDGSFRTTLQDGSLSYIVTPITEDTQSEADAEAE